jgi:hypothetical protein
MVDCHRENTLGLCDPGQLTCTTLLITTGIEVLKGISANDCVEHAVGEWKSPDVSLHKKVAFTARLPLKRFEHVSREVECDDLLESGRHAPRGHTGAATAVERGPVRIPPRGVGRGVDVGHIHRIFQSLPFITFGKQIPGLLCRTLRLRPDLGQYLLRS